RQERRVRQLLHAEVLRAELFVPAGERPAAQRSAAGEDRAVHRAPVQQRSADARQLLLEMACVMTAIHPDLAAAALVEPGVPGNLVVDAVEQTGLERGCAGRRTGAARRYPVRAALDQGAEVGRISPLHRMLELPPSDTIEVQQQHAPARWQRRARLPAAAGHRAEQVTDESLDETGARRFEH